MLVLNKKNGKGHSSADLSDGKVRGDLLMQAGQGSSDTSKVRNFFIGWNFSLHLVVQLFVIETVKFSCHATRFCLVLFLLC